MRHNEGRAATRRMCVLFLIGQLLTAGCDAPSDRPELGMVTGAVTLDGEPLAGVLVSFQPEKGRGSTGLTDENGRYSLNYVFNVPGAKVGRHTVSVSTPVGDDSDPAARLIKERVPAQYNSQTTLIAVVKPGINEINCELNSH
jgi:hypothetical protein